MDGAFDLDATGVRATFRLRVVSRFDFYDVAVGILHDLFTCNDIGMFEAHGLVGREAKIATGWVFTKIIPFNVDFP